MAFCEKGGGLFGVTTRIIGYHWWADLSGCGRNFTEAAPARELALSIVKQAGMTPAGEATVTITNGVDSGATVLMIIVPLEESHLAIHSFPEIQYAAVDLFTCGSKNLGEVAFADLCSWFLPDNIRPGYEKRYAIVTEGEDD